MKSRLKLDENWRTRSSHRCPEGKRFIVACDDEERVLSHATPATLADPMRADFI